jgi:hypothetical protein
VDWQAFLYELYQQQLLFIAALLPFRTIESAFLIQDAV